MKCNERSYKCRFPRPMDDGPVRPAPDAAFLLQRILASGRTHLHRQCYPLCLSALPREAEPPFTVTDAFLCGAPRWTQEGCPGRGGPALCVTLPIAVGLRDCMGRCYTVHQEIDERLVLRPEAPPQECWRGQIEVQAAVRLAGRCRIQEGCGCEIPLEVMIHGYLIVPCPTRQPGPCPCPDPRPLYPQPICRNEW